MRTLTLALCLGALGACATAPAPGPTAGAGTQSQQSTEPLRDPGGDSTAAGAAIDDAGAALAAVDVGRLSASDQQRLAVARDLLHQARGLLAAGDADGARALAQKAAVMGRDLAAN